MMSSSTAFLDTVFVSSLPTVDIVSVPSNATAVDALKILSKHNILSAPIYDASKNAYIGLVDMLDLATFIVGIYNDLEDEGEATDFLSTLESGERYVTENVKSIADLSNVNPFIPVFEDATLATALRLFGEKGIHRLPVINKRGQVVNLLTQSAVLQFLSSNLEKLDKQALQLVSEVVVNGRGIITVNIDATAIDAFKLMVANKINAVPVVDDTGHLIANISARDIRNIATDVRVIRRLSMPIRQYVQEIFGQSFNEGNPAISARLMDTIAEVIQKLVVSKVHRIYVVDSNHVVVGVLTLSDILLALLPTTQE